MNEEENPSGKSRETSLICPSHKAEGQNLCSAVITHEDRHVYEVCVCVCNVWYMVQSQELDSGGAVHTQSCLSYMYGETHS